MQQLGFDREPNAGAVLGRELLERVDVLDERVTFVPSCAISASMRRRSLSAMRRAVSASLTSAAALASDSLVSCAAFACASATASSAAFWARISVRWMTSLSGTGTGVTTGAGAGAGAERAPVAPVRSRLRRAGGGARRQPLLEDADLVLEVLDRPGRALEQLVHLVTVVAAERLADVDVSEFLRSHVHGEPCYRRRPESSPSVSRPPRNAPIVVCVAGVNRSVAPRGAPPCLDPRLCLADEGAQEEQSEQEDHERDVEHADRRDDLADRPQRPLGEIEEDPVQLRPARAGRIGNHESMPARRGRR